MENTPNIEDTQNKKSLDGLRADTINAVGPSDIHYGDLAIVLPKGKNHVIGDVTTTFSEPALEPNILGALMGAVLGVSSSIGIKHLIDICRSSTHFRDDDAMGKPITRRDFLAGLFSAAAATMFAPEIIEEAAKHTPAGLDPMRPVLGSRFPLESLKYFDGQIYRHPNEATIKPADLQTAFEAPDHSFTLETMTIAFDTNHQGLLYCVKPKNSNVSIRFISPLYMQQHGPDLTLGIQMNTFCDEAGMSPTRYLLGQGARPQEVAKHSTPLISKLHTVSNALVLAIDSKPIAVSSATWTHPMAITYADSIKARKDDGSPIAPIEWLAMNSCSGVWTPQMLKKWPNIYQDVETNSDIWKSIFTDSAWTEFSTQHPAHHRALILTEGGDCKIVSDENAWQQLAHAVASGTPLYKTIVKPGTVLAPSDPPIEVRENDMAINGMICDATDKPVCFVTLDQNIRMSSTKVIEVLKAYLHKTNLDPEHFTYVGFDEHAGGGVIMSLK